VSAPTTSSNCPDERRDTLALTYLADVCSLRHAQLIATFGTASRALHAGFPAALVRDACARADAARGRGERAGLELTTNLDADYPAALRELEHPPAVLWRVGVWGTLHGPVVALVGTRRATSYGERVTRQIASALARAGACIVSGMALGIDAAAHTAALEASGATVAVLGTGADVAYPRAHVSLHRTIASRGLVLSELEPGARSNGGSFPRRNRIIAGLAAVTIVVEAPIKSGALLTVNIADDLGRTIGVVPGPIDSPQSAGSNRLLQHNVHPIICADDALTLAGLAPQARGAPQVDDPTEIRVWDALRGGASSFDELCARAGLPLQQCLAAVTGLELRGAIECALTGEIRRR